MSVVLLVAALAAAVLPMPQADTARPAASTPCGFSIVHAAPKPIVVPEAVAPRVFVVSQPGSPLAVVAVDMKDSSASISGGTLQSTSSFSVDVKNVSDQPLQDTIVMVSIQTGRGGSGSGARRAEPIEPGRSVRISSQGGRGSGTGYSDQEEPFVLVYVESVRLGRCLYKPAQVLPLAASAVTKQP